MEGEDEHPITEDEHSLDSHCREIERECKKKKTQDSGKIHRLLQLTTLHRRKWLMGMASPTRVAVNINTSHVSRTHCGYVRTVLLCTTQDGLLVTFLTDLQ